MPDIYFKCPQCTHPLEASEELASQLIDCPVCKEAIEVPIQSQPPNPPVSAPPPLPISPVLPPLHQQFATPNTRLCPACKAQVSREADVCPQCGHPIKR